MERIHYQLKKRLYRLKAYRRKGFGIHSPFVFNLVTNVIETKLHYYCFGKLFAMRKKTIDSIKSEIHNTFLAKSEEKRWRGEISFIKSSDRLDRLQFRLMNFWKPNNAAFVGDCIGFSLAYMCKLDSRKTIFWLNRRGRFSGFSDKLLCDGMGLDNYKVLSTNNIDRKFDFFVISSNTDKETLNEIKDKSDQFLADNCMILVQNPHENKEVKSFWNQLKESEKFSVSLDLFHMGILIAREGMQKQDYVRKYRF